MLAGYADKNINPNHAWFMKQPLNNITGCYTEVVKKKKKKNKQKENMSVTWNIC